MSTFYLGAANSITAIIVRASAPVLGAIADEGSAKWKFLFLFAMLGIVMTGSLYFVGKGYWCMAASFYVLAVVRFSGGNIFYNALLIYVAGERRVDFASAMVFSPEYLGGGLLLALNVAMASVPRLFGLADVSEVVQTSFLTVALWCTSSRFRFLCL